MSDKRYYVLDSLRGMACLQVVIGHCFISLPLLKWLMYPPTDGSLTYDVGSFLAYSPLHFFWSATPAVKVFFVLSGFVLSLPYLNKQFIFSNYLVFFVKRVIRLYLPCLYVILFSAVIKYFLYNPGTINMFSDWVNAVWVHPETYLEWKKRLLFGESELSNIDPALWTLPIELKLSLLLPFFVFFINKLNKVSSILLVVGFTFVYQLIIIIGWKELIPQFNSLFYFTFFLWGTLISKFRIEVSNWINHKSNLFFYIFVIISLLIYTYNFSLIWFIPHKFISSINIYEDYVTGIAAVMIIVIVISDRAYKLFNHKILIYLGKISFSLYLIHPLIIVTFAYLFHSRLSEYLIICLAFIASIPFSILFYRFLEIPSLTLAQKLSNLANSRLLK